MERSVRAGIAAFRWLAWGWMATVLFFDRGDLSRTWLAWGLVGLALLITVASSLQVRRTTGRSGPALMIAELGCGGALFVGGGWAFSHAGFATAQSLGVAWPLAGVLLAAALCGAPVGAAAGLFIGICRFIGALCNGIAATRLLDASHLVSTLTPIVLFTMAGGTVGYLVRLLQRAESEVAAARAREEVARTLHDGVLQTLAVVERDAGNPELARMARDQERELRAFLLGPRPGAAGGDTGTDLATALRAAGDRFERTYGGRAEVNVLDEVPRLDPGTVRALSAAVGEALNNAGKHGRASRVTVFAEPTEGAGSRRRRTEVFCSVKDDGVGFDTETVTEGMGLSRSIRGRMAEVGGRVEVWSRAGSGAEVRLWV